MGDRSVLVGCGVYLADAPTAAAAAEMPTAPELTKLVSDAAAVLERRGEDAYPEFRVSGSSWFRDDRYLFVWRMDGTQVFNAADPAAEGRNLRDLKDIRGRPIGRMILDVAASPSGEGWVHYMYPRPGDIFPAWKSTFVKRVTLPSGAQHVIGSGIYNMQLDRILV